MKERRAVSLAWLHRASPILSPQASSERGGCSFPRLALQNVAGPGEPNC